MRTLNCLYDEATAACVGHQCYYCGDFITGESGDQVERWIGCVDGAVAEIAMHAECAVDFPAFEDAIAALAS
tara:strand:- start:1124 stop:1339 length:216 start_codon:yes stop_codon:yes gene_type:complete